MTVKAYEPHKSSLGMDANIAVLIAYLAGVVIGWIPTIGYVAWLAPLVVYLLEKESNFVRFHAMQSLLLNAVGAAFGIMIAIFSGAIFFTAIHSPTASFGLLGLIGAVTLVISIVILIFAIIAVINGYQYREYKIPVIGNIAMNITGKSKEESA
jgi:uncharacterized membrane protein